MQTFQRGQLVQVSRKGEWIDGVYLHFHAADQTFPHLCVPVTNDDPAMDCWDPDWFRDEYIRPVTPAQSNTSNETAKAKPCDDKAAAWEIASRHLDQPSVLSAVATLINTLTRACRTTK